MYPEEKRSRTVRVGTYTLLKAPLKLKKEKPGPFSDPVFLLFSLRARYERRTATGAYWPQNRRQGKKAFLCKSPAPFRKYPSLSSQQPGAPLRRVGRR